MKWISYLSTSQIPFNVYKLRNGDSILSIDYSNNSKLLIILYGSAYILKVFTNQETIPVGILTIDNIIGEIRSLKESKHYYYKTIAISETFIISFDLHALIKLKINKEFFTNILHSYQLTMAKYAVMTNILAHKDTKNRLIQLLLVLCDDHGVIQHGAITIPLSLSQKTLSIILGSNRITVARLMKQLQNKMLISYKKKYINIHNPLALSYFEYVSTK